MKHSLRLPVFLWILLLGGGFGATILRYGGEWTAPVGFGCYSDEVCFSRENADLLPGRVLVFDSGGYDGQFYYAIAAGLFSGESFRVDSLPFRLSRIGYPLLSGPAYPILGPEGLVLALYLIPVFFHIFATLVLAGYLSRFSDSILPGKWEATLLFLFNPFSWESSLLTVSDGLGLSLAVLFLGFYPGLAPAGSERNRSEDSLFPESRFWRTFLSFVFLSLALLTKETFLAIPLALGGRALFRLAHRREFGAFQELLFAALSIFPLLVWWDLVGFSPFLAAHRGGLPGAGILAYLGSPDTLLSGRTFLLILFFLLLAMGGRLLREGLAGKGHREVFMALVLVAVAFLVSFATNDEYWANFANIMRLYTPAIVGMIWFVARGKDSSTRRALPLFLLAFLALLFWKTVGGKVLPHHTRERAETTFPGLLRGSQVAGGRVEKTLRIPLPYL